MHLFHHINLQIATAMHLAKIARKNFANAHLSIISNIKSDFTSFNVILLGRTLSQHSRSPRLSIAGLGNFYVSILWISCPSRAWSLRICRAVGGLIGRGSTVRVGMSWIVSSGRCGVEASCAAGWSSGSLTVGSMADLFFFTLLLGFAFPLHKIKEVSTDIKVCNEYMISKLSLPWSGLKIRHVGLNWVTGRMWSFLIIWIWRVERLTSETRQRITRI